MSHSIGTESEHSLHRDLKFRYAGRKGRTETEIAGFVADGINAKGEIIEIQTGSFGPLNKKIRDLAARGKVTVVHPVILTKYIEVFDTKGNRLYRRKSPCRGCPWDLFDAMIYAPDLPLVPGVTVELVMVDADEKRVRDGKGSWRRRGVSIRDRTMTAFHKRIRLGKPSDYLQFVPFKKNEKFTSALLKEKAGIPIGLAQKTLYVLTKIGVIKKTGKQRNAFVYKLT